MDKQKRLIVVNYLRNYILILLLPMILLIIVYFWTLNIVEVKTFEANLSVLQHNMEIMENGMDNIGSLIYQVSLNPSINQFIRSESPFTDKTSVSDIVEAQEALAAFALTNSFIDSIHVYSNRSKVVIDQSTSFIRPNFLYELSFNYEGYSYSDWVNDVLLKTHQKEVWPAKTVIVNNNS